MVHPVESKLIEVLTVIGLTMLSALFAGLTLGLMTLDITGLDIVIASGTPKEREYATKILPLRARGNLLLCTLLLGNVLVNAIITEVMTSLTTGTVGVILSTIITVVAGEIIPQAVCSRHGLAIGAKTVNIVYFFMFLTFPFSLPISKALDWVLGEEMGTIYSRTQLKKLLDIHSSHMAESNLSRRDVTMLSGVLDYKEKKVEDVMTPMEKVFMLDISSSLDFQTITKILEKGHSRVPVYENDRQNIVGVLLVKDLAIINPEEGISLRTVLGFYNRQLPRTYTDVRLDSMLNQFKTGRSHMAVVRKVHYREAGIPEYENVGIITLEDIIEELIQDEISDEKDIQTKDTKHSFIDYQQLGLFKGQHTNMKLTPQQTTAIQAFLSGTIPEFNSDKITEKAFGTMISKCAVDVFDKPASGEKLIYKRGVAGTNYFTLVLQGKLEIRSGSEGFVSESGPFSYLAVGALKVDNYVPDFSAKVISNVQILRIERSEYLEALRSSQEERSHFSGLQMGSIPKLNSSSNGAVLEGDNAHSLSKSNSDMRLLIDEGGF
eukprot:TRINITY_DN2488_c0_g2_i2.p1 TRINITY_DN2488_c0_g2~~TRINITY_DN2488_c0_g2_i2.p1  ORF type:complete len:549 (-),score=119.29 TRINITY_DN2488_c0_g2_i2:53-1699(-)